MNFGRPTSKNNPLTVPEYLVLTRTSIPKDTKECSHHLECHCRHWYWENPSAKAVATNSSRRMIPVDDDYNEIYLPCSCMKITYW